MSDQPNTFSIPGAPEGLLAIINERRSRIPSGMRMSAEAPEGEAPEGEAPEAPKAPEAPDGGETPKAPEEDKDLSKLPRWAQSLVSDLRREAGDARTNAKAAAAEEARAALAQEIGKVLGLVKGEEKADPEELLRKVESAQSEVAASKRELAVYRFAAEAGGDPDALLDSNSFLRSIDALDADDSEKMKAAIKEAVKNNPKLSAGPRAGTKSGRDASGSGEPEVTKEAFDKMSGAEKNKLFINNPDLFNRLSA